MNRRDWLLALLGIPPCLAVALLAGCAREVHKPGHRVYLKAIQPAVLYYAPQYDDADEVGKSSPEKPCI